MIKIIQSLRSAKLRGFNLHQAMRFYKHLRFREFGAAIPVVRWFEFTSYVTVDFTVFFELRTIPGRVEDVRTQEWIPNKFGDSFSELLMIDDD